MWKPRRRGLRQRKKRDERERSAARRSLAVCDQASTRKCQRTPRGRPNKRAFYYKQAKHAEAKPLLERALAIFTASLGPEHPNTKNAADWLAKARKAAP